MWTKKANKQKESLEGPFLNKGGRNSPPPEGSRPPPPPPYQKPSCYNGEDMIGDNGFGNTEHYIKTLEDENKKLKEEIKYLHEEMDRDKARIVWHHSYVRPPKDPNYPRAISCVFAELDRLKKEATRYRKKENDECWEKIKELNKEGKN